MKLIIVPWTLTCQGSSVSPLKHHYKCIVPNNNSIGIMRTCQDWQPLSPLMYSA